MTKLLTLAFGLFLTGQINAAVNVALNKPTDGDVFSSYPTSNGNDGNLTTFTHANNSNPAPNNPYWNVDLQGVFDIDRVELTDRISCCAPNRLNGSEIRFFDSSQTQIGAPVAISGLPDNNPAGTATLTFDNGGAGWQGVQYIRVDGYTQYFQFAELAAFADLPVDPNQNIAAGKPAISSGATWNGFPPSFVNDGNSTTISHPLTDAGTLGFYYQIDLESTFTLDRILVRNRDNCCPDRLSNYRVSVFESDGTTLAWSATVRSDGSNSGQGGVDTVRAINGTGIFIGRFIRIENLNAGGYAPQIAEVEAYAAPLPVIANFTTDAGNVTAIGEPGLPTSANLSWAVSNFDTLEISPTPGTVTGPTGSASVTPAVTTTYTLTATNPAGISTASVTIGVDQAELPPVLNEFLASNTAGLEDEDGNKEDWIEIRNPNGFSLNLDGFYLTDDPANLTKWRFPAASAPTNGYVIVFASNKNRINSASELHTNFRLSGAGEYLALVDRDGTTILGQFPQNYPVTAMFPPQGDNASYGLIAGGSAAYLKPPTPKSSNGAGFAGFVRDTTFSVKRGIYTSPVSVEISTLTAGASIRYTTGGSAPSETSGTLYTGAISISSTTVLRAIAYKDGFSPTNVDTNTYIFPADVATSSALSASIKNDPTYGPQIVNALSDLPSMVITTGATINGNNEVAASLEYILPDGTPGFQETCGVKNFGGAFTNFPKKSFRLYFRGQYGATKLSYPLFEDFERGGIEAVRDFDQLNLRSGSHDMKQRGFYMSNRFTDDTMLDMGNVNPHGRFVHLYINGTYWGMYHLRERWHAAMLARYLGGQKEAYEAVNGNWNVGGWAEPGTPYDRDGSAWTNIKNLRGDYAAQRPYNDIKNYIDFMLMFMFGDSEDEYRCVGPADIGSGFKWFLNDADGFTRDTGSRTARGTPGRSAGDGPGSIFSMLVAEGHPDFKTLLADRIQFLFFNDGPMTPARNIARLQERVAEVERPMITEIARWGGSGGLDSMTSPATWVSTKNAYLNNVLPGQTNDVIGFYKSAGFYPATNAPVYSQQGGNVSAGYLVGLSATTGTVYYTVDGSDPRLPGGGISPGAFEYNNNTTPETVIPQGAAWKYLDSGADLGTSDIVVNHASYNSSHWKHPAFTDTGWSSGNAVLGYNNGGESTILGYGGNAANKHITYYFRKMVAIGDIANVLSASLKIKRDDGAVFYVNGQLINQSNMPAGVANFMTPANNAADDGAGFHTYNVPASLLVSGDNVFAVEVHQEGIGSSDLTFDFEFSVLRSGNSNNNLSLTKNAAIRARAKNGSEWSAINNAFFTVNAAPPVAPGDIMVSELHYHPASDAEGEFLEIENVSDHAVNLRGCSFTSGVEYTFSKTFDTLLASGQRLILVGSLYSFQLTWGIDLPVAGIYYGNLDNDGEIITMQDSNGTELLNFTYNDNDLWPQLADGSGHSLIFIGGHPDDPLSWRASIAMAGNPLTGDGTPFTGDASNLVGFTLADTPKISTDSANIARIEVVRNLGADKVELSLEESVDLASWAPSGFLLESRQNLGATERLIFMSPAPIAPDGRVFLRVRVDELP